MISKIIAIALFISLLCVSFPATAAELPHSIWQPLSQFEAATSQGNDAEILQLGKQLLEIMKAEPDSTLKTEFVAGKLEQISKCAERLGLYEEALSLYEQYIPYGIAMGWNDGVLYAKKKLSLLQSYLHVYLESKDALPPFFGAKFEPQSGVLFGSTYTDDSRISSYNAEKISQYFPKNNSVYLIYLEFGDELQNPSRYTNYFADAKNNGSSVLLAWNTTTSLSNIEEYDSYIKRTMNFLDSLGIPVYLRFANEMNVSPNGDDKSAYIKSFRTVATYAKQCKNLAMVWAPNDLGAIDRPFSDYYPGDEYVDWVGVSLYTTKYFLDQKDHGNQTDSANTYFITGEFANPILRMKPICAFMEENKINKPLMVTEGGVSHTIRTENEDATDWAKIQLERMYGELIREYPQLKLMCYFNVEMENEANDFALFTNQPINDLYNKLVENPYLLSNATSNAGYGYQSFEGGIFTNRDVLKLSASAWYPKTLIGQVQYFIDGNLVFVAVDSPFNFELPLSNYADGTHRIDVMYTSGGTVLLQKTIPITIQTPVSVYLNQEKVEFPDQQPVIVSGRTLVPARGVFEKLGMKVSWDAAKQKVTLQNDSTTLEIIIGETSLQKNKVWQNRTGSL